MRTFTAGELVRMRAVQDGAMQDTCRVLAYSSTPDAYNNPEATYTPGPEISCGLEMVSPDEVQASGHVPLIDALIRLPIDTILDERDRIQVTKQYGETLDTALTFEIVGPARRGPSGLYLDLKLVTD